MSSQASSLLRMKTALRLFQEATDHHASLNLLAVFLEVANNSSITASSIAAATDQSLSVTARNIAYLSPQRNPDQVGYGLVTTAENPYNRREKFVTLLPKGIELAKKIAEALA